LPELPLITTETAPAVAILGPTGSGKSELALRVAERFEGEIVNCDSIQIFRFFDVGSAKLPVSERRGIPHHLIDVADPDEVFTAGEFARRGRAVLKETSGRGKLPVVAGGTGFYLRALLDGLAPGPERDDALRERLSARERARPGSVHRILRRLDPKTAARIHPNDLPKTIRAVEICLASQRKASDIMDAGRDALTGFRVLKIGLFPDRDQLYQRLETRMERIFEAGLIEEVKTILERGYPAEAKPFESIGYKEALQVVQGALTPRDAVFYARRETRRYAKRQMTWFRQEPGLEIFRGFGDDPAVADAVERRITGFLDGRAC
jgi:tRNA dimethylallyltransferase